MSDEIDLTVAHALSGAGGGFVSMALTYPLITLSTRAQTVASKSQTKDKKVTALQAAQAILEREGVRGLYSGLESALFGITVTNFVYYYFYEGTQTFYPRGRPMSTAQTMAASAIAGSATAVLTNPIWVVNTRLTVSKTKQSSLQALQQLVKTEGVTGLFKGVGPALVLVMNPILQYTAFEQLKNLVQRRRKLSSLDVFLLGALSKIIATSVTYPYITLKSRWQVRQKQAEKEGEGDNLISGIRKIIAQEGVTGLYNGISTKVLQSALTSAFLFYFKDLFFAAAVLVLMAMKRMRA